jgi:hypothetical protein
MGAVRDGDAPVRLSASGRAGEEGGSALGDELGAQQGAQHLHADRGLEGEVEFLDGSEVRQARPAHGAGDAGLGAVGDLLGRERLKEVAVAHPFRLGAQGEFGMEAADGGQVEPLEHGVQVSRAGGGAHEATSAAMRTTYSAP